MWRKLNLHVQHCNTILFEKCAISKGISLYSMDPDQIKLRENSFKNDLKSFLSKYSFYSVGEFIVILIFKCMSVSYEMIKILLLFDHNFRYSGAEPFSRGCQLCSYSRTS
jgi:hypothetical protein